MWTLFSFWYVELAPKICPQLSVTPCRDVHTHTILATQQVSDVQLEEHMAEVNRQLRVRLHFH
jgi:hypothetical protein